MKNQQKQTDISDGGCGCGIYFNKSPAPARNSGKIREQIMNEVEQKFKKAYETRKKVLDRCDTMDRFEKSARLGEWYLVSLVVEDLKRKRHD
jgi:hypothetical protein